MKGVDVKIVVGIILLLAILLFSLAIATGALTPLSDLMNNAGIEQILNSFGIRKG